MWTTKIVRITPGRSRWSTSDWEATLSDKSGSSDESEESGEAELGSALPMESESEMSKESEAVPLAAAVARITSSRRTGEEAFYQSLRRPRAGKRIVRLSAKAQAAGGGGGRGDE